MKRHQKVWTTTAVPRMASDSGTAMLRCMQPSAAEQRSRGAAVEPGPNRGRVVTQFRLFSRQQRFDDRVNFRYLAYFAVRETLFSFLVKSFSLMYSALRFHPGSLYDSLLPSHIHCTDPSRKRPCTCRESFKNNTSMKQVHHLLLPPIVHIPRLPTLATISNRQLTSKK